MPNVMFVGHNWWCLIPFVFYLEIKEKMPSHSLDFGASYICLIDDS